MLLPRPPRVLLFEAVPEAVFAVIVSEDEEPQFDFPSHCIRIDATSSYSIWLIMSSFASFELTFFRPPAEERIGILCESLMPQPERNIATMDSCKTIDFPRMIFCDSCCESSFVI